MQVDGVGAGRRADARSGSCGVGRVGDVDDDQLVVAGRRGVDVLEVVGRGLVEVDADQREAVGAGLRHLALAAVHRLVLELGARHRADLLRRDRVADVVDRDVGEPGHHEVRRGVQEAPRDPGAARSHGGEADVGRGDERHGQPGVVHLRLPLGAVTLALGVGGAGEGDGSEGQDAHGEQPCGGGESHAGSTSDGGPGYLSPAEDVLQRGEHEEYGVGAGVVAHQPDPPHGRGVGAGARADLDVVALRAARGARRRSRPRRAPSRSSARAAGPSAANSSSPISSRPAWSASPAAWWRAQTPRGPRRGSGSSPACRLATIAVGAVWW